MRGGRTAQIEIKTGVPDATAAEGTVLQDFPLVQGQHDWTAVDAAAALVWSGVSSSADLLGSRGKQDMACLSRVKILQRIILLLVSELHELHG